MTISAPDPETIRTARRAAGLTQIEAAALCHYGHGQYWSELERGKSTMSVAAWELFMVKIGIHPLFGPKGQS